MLACEFRRFRTCLPLQQTLHLSQERLLTSIERLPISRQGDYCTFLISDCPSTQLSLCVTSFTSIYISSRTTDAPLPRRRSGMIIRPSQARRERK